MSDDSDDTPDRRGSVDPLLGLPVNSHHNSSHDSSGIELVTLDPDTDTNDTRDTTSTGDTMSSPTDSPLEPSEESDPPEPEKTVVVDTVVVDTVVVDTVSEPEPESEPESESMSEHSVKNMREVESNTRISLPPTPEELAQAEELLAAQREARIRAALAFAETTRDQEHSLQPPALPPKPKPKPREERAVMSLIDSIGSVETKPSSGSSGSSWGSLFQQSTSFLSSASKVIAKSAVDISKRIGTEYDERVPEHMKEKISASAATVVSTSKVVAQKSVEIFDKNVRPTIYNTTIGYFYTAELTSLLLLEIPENSTVLDVGIGTAFAYCQNAELLKRRKIKVVGVDIDESYILRARHSLIDYDLENEIELICTDIYKSNLDGRTFDYVVFSDSYAVIPNVNNMMRYCERFMVEYTGYMLVTSTLFDEYDETLDRIKQNLKYVSAVEYGQLMLKSDLETYITEERHSDDYEFKLVKKYNVGSTEFNSYIVRWRPGDLENT